MTETAKQIFETLGKYKDCADKIEECKPAMYDNAVALINDNNNGEAFSLFYELGDYKDSSTLYLSTALDYATLLVDKKDYTNAGKYHEIDGIGTIDQVRDRIFDVMDKF